MRSTGIELMQLLSDLNGEKARIEKRIRGSRTYVPPGDRPNVLAMLEELADTEADIVDAQEAMAAFNQLATITIDEVERPLLWGIHTANALRQRKKLLKSLFPVAAPVSSTTHGVSVPSMTTVEVGAELKRLKAEESVIRKALVVANRTAIELPNTDSLPDFVTAPMVTAG